MHQINRIHSIKSLLKLRLYNTAFTKKEKVIRFYSNKNNLTSFKLVYDNPKIKNNLTSFKLVYDNPKIKINFSKQQPQIILKRGLNQDTNAAGVWDPFPDPFQPIVEKSAETALDEQNNPKSKKKYPDNNNEKRKRSFLSPRVMDAVLTTVMGLAAVGLGGVFYQAWYEWNEAHQVELAFIKPAPLVKSRTGDEFFKREETKQIREVVEGRAPGKYFLIVGERGTGKTQLILNAMDRIKQYGVVFTDAHSDNEIFKVRLGKALKYTYREDYVGQLFAREAPERGSALLDVEKALNMVEAVAIKYSKRRGRPLVLVINNIHTLKDDEEGDDLLELLQQRAESWAATKIVTMIFNTDDYLTHERMKRDASRMEVIRVRELQKEEAVDLLKAKRKNESEEYLREIVDRIGGRLSYIDKLAREPDISATVESLIDEERTWIINQIGLIPDFEESAFDDQKYASCAWKLIREIVKSESNSVKLNDGRKITGNPKWIEMMDHDNIIMIDEHQNIRADSKILLNLFKDIVSEDDFDETLDNVCERVEEVDKEQRTRELIWSKKNDQVVRVGKPNRSWF
ncbi:5635_t:CDS:2 [Dentiscutata heterogama]|uniref:5635_t:CDS:1 n=1 Tax=Dentiscutata heterogama TaxID=1316150 RepID=A0ACA9KSP2_9GLOM|nr:5635_t:CDS:2 [Dentiscutata heterogama]